jgi:hypothetical protein
LRALPRRKLAWHSKTLSPRAAGMTACAASCVTLTRGATLSTPGFARRFSIPARAPRVVRVSAESEGSEIFTDEDPVDEKVIIEPRMTFGLDVHRRIHHEACRQMAYQAQWRAFCERCESVLRESRTPSAPFKQPTLEIHLGSNSEFLPTSVAPASPGRSSTGKTA